MTTVSPGTGENQEEVLLDWSKALVTPLIADLAGCGCFVAFGFSGHPVAIQPGALLMLISAAWVLAAIHPAMEFFWHARVDDCS